METEDEETLRIAEEWCAARGSDWRVLDEAGRGGTAPVFTVASPSGHLALKMFNREFSSGERGAESERRLVPQLELGLHDCPHLVRVHDGGRYNERLFLLMDKAPGGELEKRLSDAPRDKIRPIIHQVAKGIGFLRSKGLCHRDIKSANIFISDDWDRVTILDLSVLRHVDDPIGLGTDHGNQLPVVATSRYTPPEYLFRLIEPGPELWHAVDIYQLGGVLHDLIMREPMFETEYQINRDSNRYRFAWIVATQEPLIAAPDVPVDLLVLARRALDKNWSRRSSLRLEDFHDNASIRREQALEAFGASILRKPESADSRATVGSKFDGIARGVESDLKGRLRTTGITSRHRIEASSDSSRTVWFSWDRSAVADLELTKIAFCVALSLIPDRPGAIAHSCTLLATMNGAEKQARVELPEVATSDVDHMIKVIDASWDAFGSLAAEMMQSRGD